MEADDGRVEKRGGIDEGSSPDLVRAGRGGEGRGGRVEELRVGSPPSPGSSSSSPEPVPVLPDAVDQTLPSLLPTADFKLSTRLPFLFIVDPDPVRRERTFAVSSCSGLDRFLRLVRIDWVSLDS